MAKTNLPKLTEQERMQLEGVFSVLSAATELIRAREDKSSGASLLNQAGINIEKAPILNGWVDEYDEFVYSVKEQLSPTVIQILENCELAVRAIKRFYSKRKDEIEKVRYSLSYYFW